jgi:hypothetical protein
VVIQPALAVAFVLTSQLAGGTGRADMLAAIAGASDENRAKFPHAVVRFDFEDGLADSTDAARTGDMRDRCTAKGSYAFVNEGSRRQWKYCKEFDETDFAAHTTKISESQFTTRLDSVRAVADGSCTLLDRIGWIGSSKLNHSAEIHPGMDDFFQHARFPCDLGFPDDYRHDLAAEIRLALRAEGGAAVESVDDNVKIAGQPAVRIVLKFGTGRSTYMVDPAKGWIMVHSHFEAKGGPAGDEFYDDIRAVPGRGWLPFQWTYHVAGRAKRLVITQADFEKPPDRSEFRLEFPEARRMADLAKGLYYTEKQKTWDMAKLPSPSSPAVRPLNARSAPAASPGVQLEPPGEIEARPWYQTASLIVVALGAAGIVIYWWLARRR